MTREQHRASAVLQQAQAEFLTSYHWTPDTGTHERRWCHSNAPKFLLSYPQRDALEMTRAEPLRYGVKS